jgi:glycosyltransferase involved in cell wall biosynthesis
MLKASIALTHRLAHALVAVSIGVADDLAAFSGISRDRISVIYNPLLTRSMAAPDSVAAESVWGGWRGPRIITVGRLIPQKNHALLIRAFKKILAMHDARLLILGVGELSEATAAVARAGGVADKVLMPGETFDPTPFCRSADLFVLSSDHEGFGIVIIEALACGVPVVSTDCRSGPSEILENGRYGPCRRRRRACVRHGRIALRMPRSRSAQTARRRFRARAYGRPILELAFSQIG